MNDPDLRTDTGGRRLAAAVSINVVASAVAGIAGLLATAFIARAVPLAEFGRIVLLLTLITALAIFEGQRPVVIHRVAAGIGAPGALFRAARRINFAMAATTLGILVIAFHAGIAMGLGLVAEIALSLTIAAFFAAMQYWTFLDAEQDTVYTGVCRSISWIVLYCAFAIIAWLGLDLAAYTIAILLMHLLLATLLVRRFRAKGFAVKYAATEGDLGPSLLPPALNNILSNVCTVTMNVADRAIVGSVMGIRPAGFYSGPSELALRAVGLVRAGIQVILPWAARLSPSHQQRYWLLAVSAILLGTGAGVVVLLLWRGDFAAILLGEPFRQTGDLLGIFGISIVTTMLGYACIVQLNARGDFTLQRKAYLAGAAILLAGAGIGVSNGSLLQVACAFLIGRSVDLVLLGHLLRDCSDGPRRWFLAIAAATAVAIGAAWLGSKTGSAAGLAIAYGLGYGFWIRSRHVAP